MGWLDKLFGTEAPIPTIAQATTSTASILSGLDGLRFGRYSDNNKPYQKIQSWYKADDAFKAKQYPEAFAAAFDYMADEKEQNVILKSDGNRFTFELLQGSKKVYGECDGSQITAHASIAVMPQASNAVMRRLLELNFHLYYSRCALDDQNTLCMMFDSPVEITPPSKLYYALREMAKFADRQDDLLVDEFESLKPADMGHVMPIPADEIAVKYTYFRNWIQATLDRVKQLNTDSFSGAIATIYLGLLYRIDFLIVPEAKLMADIEAISTMYWTHKEDTALVDLNAMMQDSIRKLLDISAKEFADGLYRSKATFATNDPPSIDNLRQSVSASNNSAAWYIDNKYPDLALLMNEYGIVYNQYTYSLPAVLSDLTTIYMAVIHADFFQSLGMKPLFVNLNTQLPEKPLITQAIDTAIAKWPDKYAALTWDHNKVNYNTIMDFARTFSEQMINLNLEVKR